VYPMIPTPEQVKNIFSDSYKLYLSAHAMSDTEANWEAAYKEAIRIKEKYNCCDMIVEMLSLILGQVESEKKKAGKNKLTG